MSISRDRLSEINRCKNNKNYKPREFSRLHDFPFVTSPQLNNHRISVNTIYQNLDKVPFWDNLTRKQSCDIDSEFPLPHHKSFSGALQTASWTIQALLGLLQQLGEPHMTPKSYDLGCQYIASFLKILTAMLLSIFTGFFFLSVQIHFSTFMTSMKM